MSDLCLHSVGFLSPTHSGVGALGSEDLAREAELSLIRSGVGKLGHTLGGEIPIIEATSLSGSPSSRIAVKALRDALAGSFSSGSVGVEGW